MLASLRARPVLCLALLLYWTWINIAFQAPVFFPSFMLSMDSSFSFDLNLDSLAGAEIAPVG
jgi:hypothetical protein